MKIGTATSLLCGLLLVIVTGCGREPAAVACHPIPNGIAACLDGKPLPWAADVIRRHSADYYAPADDLVATLHATVVVSPDKKLVTVNGRPLSSTNGVSNTLERNGKLYIPISDAAYASDHAVSIDLIQDNAVNIVSPPPRWQLWLAVQWGRVRRIMN